MGWGGAEIQSLSNDPRTKTDVNIAVKQRALS